LLLYAYVAEIWIHTLRGSSRRTRYQGNAYHHFCEFTVFSNFWGAESILIPRFISAASKYLNVPLREELHLSTANDSGVITVPELVSQLFYRDLQTLSGLPSHSVSSELVSKSDFHFILSERAQTEA